MASGMSSVEVEPLLCFTVAMQVGTLLLLVRNLKCGVEPRRWSAVVLVGVHAVATLVTWALTGSVAGMLPALSLLLSGVACLYWRHESAGRSLLLVGRWLWLLAWGLVGYRWFRDSVPATAGAARWLLFAGGAASLGLRVLTSPIQMTFDTATLQRLLRRRAPRPARGLPPRREPPFPRVTVHIPCHAEPPEVVLATLDAVSRLRYPAFDVIVVDNNTKDPALWRPVEAHCARLGERFRFVHVDALPGAKGGALNLALRLTPQETEVVAVLDADFICEPDFLEALVGFFDDPAIDYVQTPHDYRDWEGRWFLRGAYWEERLGNALMFPGLGQRGLTLLIGTTCLIRRQTLEAVGGWSETCLTEDVELSMRIGIRGGQGLFLQETFARGLLPQDFEQLKAQRFRWVAGPSQQLRMHGRALLTRQPGGTGPMSRPRRFHLFSSLNVLATLLEHGVEWLVMAGLVGLLWTGVAIPLPPVLFVLLGVGVLRKATVDWLVSRLLGCGFRDMIAVGIVGASLSHIKRYAQRAGFSRRPWAWRRTSKFEVPARGWRTAVASTREELLKGLVWLGLLAAFLSKANLSAPDLFLLCAAICASHAFMGLCAPFLALVAESEVRKAERARLGPAATAPATVMACRPEKESPPGARGPR
jgi:cellulose synthase/poly-beta-1,6-N-acetylglucosamine synthase-like glycosyltransferase